MFEGCAILTTNLQRTSTKPSCGGSGRHRVSNAVVEQRTQLWQRAIRRVPPSTTISTFPRSPSSSSLQVVPSSPGHQRLHPGIHACEPVAEAHRDSCRQEYVKMGKQVTAVHFGEWHEFVKTL